MKIAKKLKGSETTGPKTMPSDLRDKLNGLTVNEAIERGLITDLGDETGKFIFKHADENIEALYGVVNGYAVRVSEGLSNQVDDVDDIIGDLRFTKGISSIEGDGFGKEFFRLGMPAGIRLGESVYTLSAETVGQD